MKSLRRIIFTACLAILCVLDLAACNGKGKNNTQYLNDSVENAKQLLSENDTHTKTLHLNFKKI